MRRKKSKKKSPWQWSGKKLREEEQRLRKLATEQRQREAARWKKYRDSMYADWDDEDEWDEPVPDTSCSSVSDAELLHELSRVQLEIAERESHLARGESETEEDMHLAQWYAELVLERQRRRI
jgi:hypothetical protein